MKTALTLLLVLNVICIFVNLGVVERQLAHDGTIAWPNIGAGLFNLVVAIFIGASR